MSAEAVGWVYRHSPFDGATFQVHHAVADSVNDQHGNEFWLTKAELARKARTSPRTASSALAALTAAGCVELVEESGGRNPSRYRFLFPDADVVYDTRRRTMQRSQGSPRPNRATTDSEPCNPPRPTLQSDAPHKGITQVNPRGTQEAPAAPTRRDLLFEAVAEAWTGQPWPFPLTDRAKGRIVAALSDLRRVEATPEEVRRRAANYLGQYQSRPTPTALASHWPALDRPSTRGQPQTNRRITTNTEYASGADVGL